MQDDADARAYDALSRHPRRTDLESIALAALTERVTASDPAVATAVVRRLAEQRQLTGSDAETPFGNALAILERRPSAPDEHVLARALAALAFASCKPTEERDRERQASGILSLASRSPFDATSLVDIAWGDRADAVWTAFAKIVERFEEGVEDAVGRGEGLVAALALASSRSAAASRLASELVARFNQGKLVMYLRPRVGPPPAAVAPLHGEFAPRPRGPVATTVLALTGVSLVLLAARFVGRVVLAYRRPAEVMLSEDGGLRVRWRVELIGRTLCDHDVLVPRTGLLRASRDVRFPSLALYAALLALALGSYIGLWALVDGLRAESPALVSAGLVIVILGLVLDLALSSIGPGLRGTCRVLFVARDGSPFCVRAVKVTAADAMLSAIAHG